LKALDEKINYIEVVDINDHLIYFYWGRHKDHSEMNMRLGGGTYVIYRGDSAIVVDTMDLWLEDLKVELHEFAIHCKGHLAVYLPDDKILLTADMLEDPIWIFKFDFATPESQLAEFERMRAMDIERIYSSHCNLNTVKAGGYDKNFIKNNVNYLKRMLADAGHSDFGTKRAQDYISDAVSAGELTWWEPYAEVHARNIDTIKNIGLQ